MSAAAEKSPVKRVVDCVLGSAPPVYSPAELSAASRLLSRPGIDLDKISLLMAIASSSRHWESIIVSVEKLELHLDKMLGLLAKDPSAPGNRAGEEAYHPKADTPDQIEFKERYAKQWGALVADTQKPWLDLIEQARAAGLRGPAVGRWVFAEYERLNPKKAEVARAGAQLFARAQQLTGTVPPSVPPSRRGHIEPQRTGNPAAPKRAEPEEHARAWHGDEEGEGE